ncbi:DNA helicase [Tanacetum coccineum]
MRLNNNELQDIDKERVSVFAQWLLNVGNGNLGTPDDSDPDNCSWVDIPEHYCIPDDEDRISKLIHFIYDDETLRHLSAVKLQDKAIMCPKNYTADIINNKVLSLLPGRTYTYVSYDDAIPHGHDGGEVELLYPKEYLNTLSFAGLPPHSNTVASKGNRIPDHYRYKNISKSVSSTHTVDDKRSTKTLYLQKETVSGKATTPDGLKVLINRQSDRSPTTTRNIVYRDFLSEVDVQ